MGVGVVWGVVAVIVFGGCSNYDYSFGQSVPSFLSQLAVEKSRTHTRSTAATLTPPTTHPSNFAKIVFLGTRAFRLSKKVMRTWLTHKSAQLPVTGRKLPYGGQQTLAQLEARKGGCGRSIVCSFSTPAPRAHCPAGRNGRISKRVSRGRNGGRLRHVQAKC